MSGSSRPPDPPWCNDCNKPKVARGLSSRSCKCPPVAVQVSGLTVSAKLVAHAGMLPPIFLTGAGNYALREFILSGRIDEISKLCVLALTDSQTAVGLMLKLAEWKGVQIDRVQGIWLEWRGSHGWELGFSYRYPAPRVQERVEAMFWRVETEPPGPIYPLPNADTQCEPEEALKIIIEHIGMDHAIQRVVWGEVQEAGELADFDHERGNLWSFGRHYFDADLLIEGNQRATRVLALADIIDPDEALRAIYAEVCGG